jgi:hypothetical protein
MQALVKQLQLNTRDAGTFIDQLNEAGGGQMFTNVLCHDYVSLQHCHRAVKRDLHNCNAASVSQLLVLHA